MELKEGIELKEGKMRKRLEGKNRLCIIWKEGRQEGRKARRRAGRQVSR